MNNITDNNLIGNVLGIGALAIVAMIVTRVIKKQSKAAQIRKDNPNISYHAGIVQAFNELGYDHPFKI
jgi:hypothetical protein